MTDHPTITMILDHLDETEAELIALADQLRFLADAAENEAELASPDDARKIRSHAFGLRRKADRVANALQP